MMMSFHVEELAHVEDLTEECLSELADYLVQVEDPPQAAATDAYRERLRWKLAEGPFPEPELECGYVIRNGHGKIAGALLIHPRRFRWQNRVLRALGGGAFYADPQAGFQAALAFRRFLRKADFDFYFATSCNPISSAFYNKSGGVPVAGSDVEYLLPIRHGPLVEEAALRRGWGPLAARLVRTASFAARLAPRRFQFGTKLDVQVTRDWQLMAETWESLRDAELLTLERSPAYFEWLYGSAQSDCDLPYVVRSGNRLGWFSLSRSVRGTRQQIRAVAIADWCLPPEVNLAQVLAAVRDITTPEADVLVIRGRCHPALPSPMPGIHQRKLPSATAFVVANKEPATTIAGSLEVAAADGF